LRRFRGTALRAIDTAQSSLNGVAEPHITVRLPIEGDEFEASGIVISDRAEEAATLPREARREQHAHFVEQSGCQKGAVQARAGVHSDGADTTLLTEASQRRLKVDPNTSRATSRARRRAWWAAGRCGPKRATDHVAESALRPCRLQDCRMRWINKPSVKRS
jgi:hypothetical protein